ncbi:FAD-dependent monooxygenase [Streptomyces sp. NPDC054784]
MDEGLRVLIAGAGIGGLTAALSLHAAGFRGGVVVVDPCPPPVAEGAGLNLLPHAVRELTELDLGEQLAEAAAEPRELVYADRHGNTVVSHPRGRYAGYRWPQLSVHRAELQRVLRDAVRDRLGPDTVRAGLALGTYEQRPDGVRAVLRRAAADRGGPAGQEEIDADVLVGCDGLHSAVRRRLHPGEGAPRWNGIRMWRGVTEAPLPLDGRTMLVAGSYRPARVVVYPLADKRVAWVAEVRVAAPNAVPSTAPGEADWAREGRLADVLPYFDDWCVDGLDVVGLMRAAPTVLEFPMVDRDPLDSWTDGRVTLLGDAAHPMLPVGSNGGSQAVLDARVLAWALARHPGDPAAGLLAYEDARRAPANRILAACRDMAADRVLDTVAQRAPEGFRRIEDVLTQTELDRMRAGTRRVTDEDVAALNAQPSWSVDAPRP